MAWRISEVQNLIESKAWSTAMEREQTMLEFAGNLTKSVNETIGGAAEAITKTIAARRF